MAEVNLPNTLLKLGLALAKHHVKNVIGDEALEVVATTLTVAIHVKYILTVKRGVH